MKETLGAATTAVNSRARVARAPREPARPHATAKGSSLPPLSPKLTGRSHCCHGATRAPVLYRTGSVRYYYMCELSDEPGTFKTRALHRRNGGWERRFLFSLSFLRRTNLGGD